MPDLLDNLLAIESWDTLDAPPIDRERAAEAVRRCLELPARVTRAAYDAFGRAPLAVNPGGVRRKARLMFAHAKQAVRQTMDLANILAEEGVSLPGAEQLPETLQRLETQERDAFQHWELFTQQAEDEALAASARGETLDATDAFAQMAGLSREQWLAKVEAYKRSRGQ
jgi:hypothetical protein